jgi:hypothetical protein
MMRFLNWVGDCSVCPLNYLSPQLPQLSRRIGGSGRLKRLMRPKPPPHRGEVCSLSALSALCPPTASGGSVRFKRTKRIKPPTASGGSVLFKRTKRIKPPHRIGGKCAL